jgi:hypothetical protein
VLHNYPAPQVPSSFTLRYAHKPYLCAGRTSPHHFTKTFSFNGDNFLNCPLRPKSPRDDCSTAKHRDVLVNRFHHRRFSRRRNVSPHHCPKAYCTPRIMPPPTRSPASFSTLPAELRLKIWHDTFEPRTLSISIHMIRAPSITVSSTASP